MELLPGKHVHLIGIGGVGMSAIAQVLLKQGLKVSGSDVKENLYTIRLKDQGAKIFIEHHGRNVRGADAVVYSTAIRIDNPEFAKAKQQQIPVIPRARMLGQIMATHSKAIAVSGTHGKTTTTAMISMIMKHVGLDPSYLVGGDLADWSSNADLGNGTYVVAEADESDGSFIELHADVAVITNIEMEHCDFYPNMDAVYKSFAAFVSGMRPGGRVVLQGDHPNTESFLKRIPGCKVETYGLSRDRCTLWADGIEYVRGKLRFYVHEYDRNLGCVELKVVGEHNVLNALAALMVTLREGVRFEQAVAALSQFSGAKKRFQLVGQGQEVSVYEDYAHHPTEVSATLQGAHEAFGRRLVCVFQPHRFSRVQALRQQFRDCFVLAKEVVITAVYSAGEDPIDGVNGEILTETVAASGQSAHYFARKDEIPEFLIDKILQSGDIVIVMGAGDIHSVARELAHRLHLLDQKGEDVRPELSIVAPAPKLKAA